MYVTTTDKATPPHSVVALPLSILLHSHHAAIPSLLRAEAVEVSPEAVEVSLAEDALLEAAAEASEGDNTEDAKENREKYKEI